MHKALLLLTLLIYACNSAEKNPPAQEKVSDHLELKTMYEEDQANRMSGNIDWQVVSRRDSLREARVYTLLDSNLVRTSADHYYATMIFQHGGDTVASGMAVKMMRKAVALDAGINKWLLAAAIDRDLMRKGQPQIYGTQFTKSSMEAPWELYQLDSTQVSDEERKEYGVETLAEQKEKLKMMNKKKLSELLASGRDVDEIVAFTKQEDKEYSVYDLSEAGINQFGYQLMVQNKHEEALKIFSFNTQLYPEGFNTYDSYGECLRVLGKTEEAVAAYKRSLALNPENTNAERVLAEMQAE
ncbi:tetratricopeptide repeat protein [Catalinimonas sp. 4WD22]|uniref:tetratricopeptide repeat protein n=1 Tax=Catalinimonas locisalis TaxID=3133978 RepID=UPI003100BC70